MSRFRVGATQGDVIIDVPSVRRELSATPVLVYPQDPTQGVADLLSVSPVANALRQEFDAHVKKCRILLHPELAPAVRGRQTEVRERVRRTLEQS